MKAIGRAMQEQLENSNTALDKQAAAKRAEAYARQDFYEKAERFVELWEKMAEELNTKRTVNYKLAKKVSKAFHELETSDGWPVREK